MNCERCGEEFQRFARQRHCSVHCRFLSKIDYESDETCWVWVGPKDTYGYGQLRIDGTLTLVHRWSFEHLGRGTLVPGLVLDHLCRNRACVNPRHLEQVDHAENMRRTRPDFCERGHSMEDACVRKNGSRYCRHCRNAGARAKYALAKSDRLDADRNEQDWTQGLGR